MRATRSPWLRWRWAALTFLALALAAACGQDASDPTPDPAPSPDPTPDPAPTPVVQVHFTNDRLGDPCGEVFPVDREVDAGDRVTAALESLFAGPTDAEREEGYSGWFSDETVGLVTSVLVEDGTARADFAGLDAVIPNASTSCGSAALLAELDTTLLQFPEVDDTLYSLDGDVEAFYEWLQLSPPE